MIEPFPHQEFWKEPVVSLIAISSKNHEPAPCPSEFRFPPQSHINGWFVDAIFLFDADAKAVAPSTRASTTCEPPAGEVLICTSMLYHVPVERVVVPVI